MTATRWTPALPTAALTFLLVFPSFAAGQAEVRVSPRVGALVPLGEYHEAAPLESGDFVSYDELDGMALLGLDVHLSRPGAWWAVQVGGTAGVAGDATGMWDCRQQVCPDFLIPVASDVGVVMGSGALVLQPDLGLGPIRPFVLGGVGFTRYTFEWSRRVRGIIEPGELTRSAFATHIGAGARWERGKLGWEVRVEDVISFPDRPEGGAVHALGVSGALGYRLF